jgi:hypothetical protein
LPFLPKIRVSTVHPPPRIFLSEGDIHLFTHPISTPVCYEDISIKGLIKWKIHVISFKLVLQLKLIWLFLIKYWIFSFSILPDISQHSLENYLIGKLFSFQSY